MWGAQALSQGVVEDEWAGIGEPSDMTWTGTTESTVLYRLHLSGSVPTERPPTAMPPCACDNQETFGLHSWMILLMFLTGGRGMLRCFHPNTSCRAHPPVGCTGRPLDVRWRGEDPMGSMC